MYGMNGMIDESKVKNVLRYKDKILTDIKTKHDELVAILGQTDAELIAASAYPHPGANDGMPRGRGESKDLADVITDYERNLRREKLGIKRDLNKLEAERNRVIRIWRCYLALPEPHFGVIKALYVDGDLYAAAEQDFGYSHKTFEKTRQEGMRFIMAYYESDLTDSKLRAAGSRTLLLYPAAGKTAQTPGQMSLFAADRMKAQIEA